MKAKISIITPTYNAEKFIGRCLDYSLGQTYQNIEVIVVDDGSTDSTLKIEKQYAKKDARIKLVQQKHKGPNAARKKGIDVATGEYVMFVDADDYLDKKAVAKLLNVLLTEKVDTIRFNAVFGESGKSVSPILQDGKKKKVLNKGEIIYLLLTTYKLNSLWTRIYKKDTLKNVKSFDYNIRFGEDFLVNLEACSGTDSMLIISDELYHYCDNPKSTTRNVDKKQLLSNLSDRVFVSKKAIEYCMQERSCEQYRNDVIFAQLRMVVESMQKLAAVQNYKKDIFIKDIQNILKEDTFSMVNYNEFKQYISGLSLKSRLKNKAVILAIINADYSHLWHYIELIKLYKKLRNWRAK